MAMAVVAPLYSWLIAAACSSCGGALHEAKGGGGGRRGEEGGSQQPLPMMSRRARRLRRRSLHGLSPSSSTCALKNHITTPKFSSLSHCGSGLGFGSCFSFEACPEYYSSTQSPLFGGSDSIFGLGLGSRPSRRTARRHPKSHSGSGKAWAIVIQPARESTDKKKIATKPRRVVVTGMGVVSCLGHDPDSFYNNLLDGKSGITEIENFDCKDFPTRIAGEIKSFSTDGWVAPKFSRRMDKFMLYTLTAGKKALEDGGISLDAMDELDKSKCGILIGSALGGMKVFNDAIEALRVSYRKMNPFCVPFATTNMGSAMLAMDLGWMGPNYSISTACATSNFCILNSANHILRGEADVMLCGGADSAIIPIGAFSSSCDVDDHMIVC